VAQQNLSEAIHEVQPARLLSFPQVPPRRDTRDPDPDSPDSTYQENCADLERAISSVSFLLDWSSGLGNHPLDGAAVVGLAKILERCAEDLARSRRLHSRVMTEMGEIG
jgi:hypothetical protein